MTELLVIKISIEDSVLLISASPHWSIIDLSIDDDVVDLTVHDPIYIDSILKKDIELIAADYDLDNGEIVLWDDNDGSEYTIRGKVSENKRWYSKKEIVILVERMKLIYQSEAVYLKSLNKTLNETKNFVHEAYRRSEIRLTAGKKVHVLDLLGQIKRKLDVYHLCSRDSENHVAPDTGRLCVT